MAQAQAVSFTSMGHSGCEQKKKKVLSEAGLSQQVRAEEWAPVETANVFFNTLHTIPALNVKSALPNGSNLIKH